MPLSQEDFKRFRSIAMPFTKRRFVTEAEGPIDLKKLFSENYKPEPGIRIA